MAWTLLSDSPTISTVGDGDNEGPSPNLMCASLQNAAAYFHKVGAMCYALFFVGSSADRNLSVIYPNTTEGVLAVGS